MASTVCPHGSVNGPCNACRTEAIRNKRAAKTRDVAHVQDREMAERYRAITLAGARGVTWAQRYISADTSEKRGMLLDLDQVSK